MPASQLLDLLKKTNIHHSFDYLDNLFLLSIGLKKNNKEKLSGLIIDGGMSSFADVATLFAPQYAQYIEQILKGVYQSKEDLKFTQGLPKLFIYNKKDATVPFLQGQTNFANAAEPKTFLEAGNEHIQAMKDEESVVLKAISNL